MAATPANCITNLHHHTPANCIANLHHHIFLSVRQSPTFIIISSCWSSNPITNLHHHIFLSVHQLTSSHLSAGRATPSPIYIMISFYQSTNLHHHIFLLPGRAAPSPTYIIISFYQSANLYHHIFLLVEQPHHQLTSSYLSVSPPTYIIMSFCWQSNPISSIWGLTFSTPLCTTPVRAPFLPAYPNDFNQHF